MFAFRRTMYRRRVMVNLRTGKAFQGILWAHHGPLLVLRDATLLQAGMAPSAVDGEIVIERTVVEFVQVLPGDAA